ncbi:MAG: DMT family transporter [Pseudomonadota bacterium]
MNTRTPFASIAGPALGALTVLCWSAYNVAAKQGIDEGLAPEVLSFLRFSVPGLIAVPTLAVFLMKRRWSPVPLHRLAVLTFLGGPVFGVMAVSGYSYAPLSHGLLFAPVAVFLSAAFFGRLLLGEAVTRPRIFGALTMFSGLAVLVGFETSDLSEEWLRGTLFFGLAGAMWGAYTVLLKHWQIPFLSGALAVSAGSSFASLIVLGPVVYGAIAVTPVESILFQAVMQGLVGGVLSVIALIGALRALSAQTAALLPTFSPAVALLIAALFGAAWPTPAELIGMVVIALGFMVASGFRARWITRGAWARAA